MAIVDTSHALADAQNAWESGFSIIASKLNEVLQKHATGLRISSPPPKPGQSLQSCRRLFLDGLRRSLVPMPPENEIAPWTMGYVNDRGNQESRIGIGGMDPDEELEFTVKFLSEHRANWNAEHWDNFIVKAVNLHASDRRQWFSETQSRDCDDMGISLNDIALFLHPDDENLCKKEVRYLGSSKRINAPKIGKCPSDRRASLYRLSEILPDIEKIYGLSRAKKTRLNHYLASKSRHPFTTPAAK